MSFESIETDDPVLTDLIDQASYDDEAAAVLLDALIERPNAWRDERVMMLCLGVPLEPRAPKGLGADARKSWRRKRTESMTFALSQWDLYVGRADHHRAILALVLFGTWKLVTQGGSPWAVARRADAAYLDRLRRRRERRRYVVDRARDHAAEWMRLVSDDLPRTAEKRSTDR